MSPTVNVTPPPNIICQSFKKKQIEGGGLYVYSATITTITHLLSDFASKFKSFMTIFPNKLQTREGRNLANGWTRPPIMTILSVLHDVCNNWDKYLGAWLLSCIMDFIQISQYS